MSKQLDRFIEIKTHLILVVNAHFCHVYCEVMLVGHDDLYFIHLKDRILTSQPEFSE